MAEDDVDPVWGLVRELATADRPSSRWLEAHAGDGDPVTRAWLAGTTPTSMVRLLAMAGNADVDAAAQAAIRGAAETLRRENPGSAAIETLMARAASATACGELSRLLHVVWLGALRRPERRDALEAELAERMRAAVRRPPRLADLEPPPRRTRTEIGRGAGHLADLIGDPGRLGVLDADSVRRTSRGQVISPESFGRSGPELGGLFCERAFGGWWPRSLGITEDDRGEHWGHIELAHPCAHPIVPGARLAVVPVVPPHYRRWTAVPVEELRRYARERRAELEAREEELCDPPDKILAEQGLEDPDALTEPGLREHVLCTVYRSFINYDRRRERLVELNAPPEIIAADEAMLDETGEQLVRAWRKWLDELPEDVEPAWALRALAVTPA